MCCERIINQSAKLTPTDQSAKLTTTDNDNMNEEEILQILENEIRKSPLFNSNPPPPLPCYKNVETGDLLGQGQFGTVREITGFPNSDNDDPLQITRRTQATTELSVVDDDSDLEDAENDAMNEEIIAARRMDLGKRCWRNGKARYAVKALRADLLEDEERRCDGLIDLAIEANLLGSLSHPNIVKIRGTLGVPGRPDFMLILDRLYLTLDDKISLWKSKQFRIRTKYAFGLRKKKTALHTQNFLIERLVAAFDIARVFKYLHEQNIIYRDLKPENIGYDIRGDLRIFDFGLAREVTKADLVKLPEDYNCTGMTGSRRWMAPEVYHSLSYGPSADVFSFGLLFWNIFSLKTPFGRTSIEKHFNDVMVNHKRPANLKFLSRTLNVMMSHCWSTQRDKRPTFSVICSILRFELEGLQEELVREMRNKNKSASGDSQDQAEADYRNDEIMDRTTHLETKSLNSANDLTKLL